MAVTPSTMLPLGTPAPDFALPEARTGAVVARRDFAARPLLVAFICNHCPFVVHLRDHFLAFARSRPDLAVVGISANDPEAYPADAPAAMAAEAIARDYPFPYLFDATQAVAKAYRAACTPDFFLFAADHRLAYRGRYDASRPTRHGQAGTPPDGAELAAAVDAVLAGRPVAGEQRPSLGCNIKWRPGNEPTSG